MLKPSCESDGRKLSLGTLHQKSVCRIVAVLILLCCVSFFVLSRNAVTLTSGAVLQSADLFDNFIQTYRKHYGEEERARREKIFLDNVAFINAAAKTVPYKIKVNAFADLTRDEFKRMYLGLEVDTQANTLGDAPILGALAPMHADQIPPSVDWVERGKVTPVLNQRTCGACYTFSAASALESVVAIAKGTAPVRLSNQQILDCSGQRGCGGGTMNESFDYVAKAGICSYDSYPYMERMSKCRSCDPIVPPGYVLGYRATGPDELSLLTAVMRQPVSVGIEADGLFQYYSEGVFTQKCGTKLDHGVLIVGYGVLDGTKYWRIKNSWGSLWGNNGYALMERGNKQEGGECGILKFGSYPVVSDPLPGDMNFREMDAVLQKGSGEQDMIVPESSKSDASKTATPATLIA